MTSAGGTGTGPAAGEPVRHIPVLREEAVAALQVRPGGLYVDATFGAGGYTRAILAVDGARVVALDRDPSATRAGAGLVAAAAGRLRLAHARFSDLEAQLDTLADGVVLDVGVSSMQLDEAGRGFSFRFDGPLDMRMESDGRSAADLVNESDEAVLADILYHYGEERASRRIARAIAMDRRNAPFTTTRSLAEMIARVAPTHGDIHPATRSFQALRIAVNDELGELVDALEAAERALKPGGRLVVVTFHSLEDRIVKRFLAAASGSGAAASRHLPSEPAMPPPTFVLDRRQPVVPSADEARRNPRARSAKLRAASRTDAAARGAPAAVRALAELPHRPGTR